MEKVIGRRERRKQQAREQIMKSAVELFAEKGLQETTIAEIMKAVDLGTGTFYNYFASKEEVVYNYIQAQVRGAKTEIEKIIAVDSITTNKLEQIMYIMGQAFEKNRPLIALFFQLMRTSPKINAPGNHGSMFSDIILKVIKEGQLKGEIRKDIPSEVIMELIHGALQSSIISSNRKIGLTKNLQYKIKLLIGGVSGEKENKRCKLN